MATGDDIVRLARSQIGKPYIFGASGPNSFDCSGLVLYCFKNVSGMSLPHSSSMQLSYGTEVKRTELGVGDLIFPSIGHVQIYSGNGNVVEAAQPGTNIREVPIWGFWRARRLITPGTGGGGSQPGTPGVTPIVDPVTPLLPYLVPLFGLVSEVTNLVKWFVNPKNWLRMAIFGVGLGLVVVALVKWNNVLSAAKEVANV